MSPPARGISGRKAPRVQRIASSLRGEVREAALSTDRASGRAGRTLEISAGSLADRASPRRLQPGGERSRDTRCPSHIGLGRSLHCEPSRLEGACRASARARTRYKKAPDPRDLGSAVLELLRSNGDARGHHRGPALRERRRGESLGDAIGARYRTSDGRACGSSRWQKSTNDAWPRAHGSDELTKSGWV